MGTKQLWYVGEKPPSGAGLETLGVHWCIVWAGHPQDAIGAASDALGSSNGALRNRGLYCQGVGTVHALQRGEYFLDDYSTAVKLAISAALVDELEGELDEGLKAIGLM